jgi:hypothetical protein
MRKQTLLWQHSRKAEKGSAACKFWGFRETSAEELVAGAEAGYRRNARITLMDEESEVPRSCKH